MPYKMFSSGSFFLGEAENFKRTSNHQRNAYIPFCIIIFFRLILIRF